MFQMRGKGPKLLFDLFQSTNDFSSFDDINNSIVIELNQIFFFCIIYTQVKKKF